MRVEVFLRVPLLRDSPAVPAAGDPRGADAPLGLEVGPHVPCFSHLPRLGCPSLDENVDRWLPGFSTELGHEFLMMPQY